MNLRENVLATLRFGRPQRTPRWELGYWAGTLQRWYSEGLTGVEQARWQANPGLAGFRPTASQRQPTPSCIVNTM